MSKQRFKTLCASPFILALIVGCSNGGGGSTSASSPITVTPTPTPTPTPANEPPEFSGTFAFEFTESQPVLFDIDVADPDGDDVALSLSLDGDGALFRLDADERLIEAMTAFEFARPIDEDLDNMYEVVVEAADGAATISQTYRVTIQDDGAGSANPPRLQTGESRFERLTIDTTMPLTHMNVPADFDGDGDTDLVATSEEADTVAWYRNLGDLQYEKVLIDTNLDSAYPVSTADLDSDGDVDVLAGGYREDLYVWYENDGQGGFTRRVVGERFGPHSITAVDFDGDGDMDVVTASQDASAVSWYENDGEETFTERKLDQVFVQAKTAFAGDLDQDGDFDILATAFAWMKSLGIKRR